MSPPVPNAAPVGPRVSAAVCTYNRLHFLPRCLESLIDQTYQDYEVLVIDDGSSDGTAEFLQEFQQRAGIDVPCRFVRHNRNRGLGAARNTAVDHASGSVIAFTDDDCIVSRDWIETLARHHAQEPQIAAVGGPVMNGYRGNTIANIGQQIVTHRLHDRLVEGRYTSFLVGNNQSYKKSAVLDAGYFSESLRFGGEEAELQERLLAKGYKLLFAPDVTVEHFQRSTLRSFLRQYFTYGINLRVAQQANRGLRELHPDMPLFRRPGLMKVLRQPYDVSTYVRSHYEKLLCYPLVYSAYLSRLAGYCAASLGVCK